MVTFLVCFGVYILGVLLCMLGYLQDWIRYWTTGRLDNKFPCNCWATFNLCLCFASIWPILFVLLVTGSIRNVAEFLKKLSKKVYYSAGLRYYTFIERRK